MTTLKFILAVASVFLVLLARGSDIYSKSDLFLKWLFHFLGIIIIYYALNFIEKVFRKTKANKNITQNKNDQFDLW